jgi:hypothetical protein
MKYGKAVAKKVIGISRQDFNAIMDAMIAFARINNLRMNYEPHDETYIERDKDGYRHEFKFEPIQWNDGTVNLMAVSHKTKTLRINSPNIPAIVVMLSHNKELTEDTNEWVEQYQFYVSTTALQEREYRCRNWECFSGYNSFDYDTDVEEIIKSIKSSLQYIVDAYRPLFA